MLRNPTCITIFYDVWLNMNFYLTLFVLRKWYCNCLIVVLFDGKIYTYRRNKISHVAIFNDRQQLRIYFPFFKFQTELVPVMYRFTFPTFMRCENNTKFSKPAHVCSSGWFIIIIIGAYFHNFDPCLWLQWRVNIARETF